MLAIDREVNVSDGCNYFTLTALLTKEIKIPESVMDEFTISIAQHTVWSIPGWTWWKFIRKRLTPSGVEYMVYCPYVMDRDNGMTLSVIVRGNGSVLSKTYPGKEAVYLP